MNRPLFLFPFAIALTVFLGACATTPAPQPAANSQADRAQRAKDLFNMFDENSDGFLTRAEMKRSMTYAGNYNPNSNVMLGLEAKKKDAKAQAKPMTAAEVQKAIDAAFVNDADLDSRLSEQEFKKLIVERKPNEPDPFATL